jgi:hypothetical protein
LASKGILGAPSKSPSESPLGVGKYFKVVAWNAPPELEGWNDLNVKKDNAGGNGGKETPRVEVASRDHGLTLPSEHFHLDWYLLNARSW